MRNDEYYRIAALEHEHWWYCSLHYLVLAALKSRFSHKEIKIIDAGCGTGGLMMFLKNRGYKNIKGFDISETAVKLCKEKGLDVFKGDLKEISKYFDSKCADVIISNDSLYFLDGFQQRETTGLMHGLLKKNGLLIINFPSLRAFSGNHDLQVGITRRLSKKDIWNLCDNAKFSLLKKMYWPFIASFGIWVARYIQRLQMKINKSNAGKSDLKHEWKLINSFLFFITHTENKLLHNKPFGSSLFLILRANSI